MKIKYSVLAIMTAAIFGLSSSIASAQYIEDAIRYSRMNGTINARSAALGISYLGLLDDVAAINYNPAGLTLLPKSEFSIGMNFLRDKTESFGYNTRTEEKSNKENFNNISIASPFYFGNSQSSRGAVGLSYSLEGNYYQNFNTSWFNPSSTMVKYLAENQPDIAYHLWLSPESNKSLTPVKDSLQQTSSVIQTGGMHNLSGSAAFELNPNVSIGVTLSAKWGNYKYDRIYEENDINNKYNVFNEDYSMLDFNRLKMYEGINDDITGITGSVGILGKIGTNIRVSAAVRFPTFYQITEDYSLRVENYWDNGTSPNPYTYPNGSVSYNLRTPFAYNAGLSFYVNGFAFTTGLEYTDASQTEFSDPSLSSNTTLDESSKMNVEAINRLIIDQLIGQVTWGFGAEYSLPLLPVSVRASYTSTTSPYTVDVSGANRRILAFGAGISLAKGIRLDGAFRLMKFTEFRTLYGNDLTSRYTIDSSPTDIVANLTIRF